MHGIAIQGIRAERQFLLTALILNAATTSGWTGDR
jgi:hypothetical protein